LKEEGGEAKPILSLTYGENDVEPKHVWYNFVKESKWGWNTSNVDAYILFNSSFYVKYVKNVPIQMIHGGFKAVMWNPLGCFKASTPPDYCLSFSQVDKNLKSRIPERVQVNPHWIRGDYENEDISDYYGYILMIVGDDKIEDDKSSWFFSLPIAPHILYLYVYHKLYEYGKLNEEELIKKLNLAVNIIRSRLGTENDIRERVNRVVELLKSDIKRDEERKYLDNEVRPVLEDMLRSYASKTLSEQVKGWLEECEKSVKDGRRTALLQLFEKGGVIPKYWFDKKRGDTINASYLDIAIMHPSNYENKDLGVLAWAFGLALIVLMDSYTEFVKRGTSVQRS